jgi:8-oxo-dGTP pyrophosphatase MutT (NUDIX family)
MDNVNRLLILAAGGLVLNERGEVLFMFRKGKWDLPKGKLDPGETMDACALREVMEETGLVQVELKNFLLVTEHLYTERGKQILKKSHWYQMEAGSHQRLIPQAEEEISELRWLAPADFNIVLANTYPSIVEVLEAGGFSLRN